MAANDRGSCAVDVRAYDSFVCHAARCVLTVTGGGMALHVLIIDQDARAAQVTRLLLHQMLPTATVRVAAESPSVRNELATDAPPLLILDPAGVSAGCVQELCVAQQHQPALAIVVLTAEPPARRAHQLHGLRITALLDKGEPPDVLRQRFADVFQRLESAATGALPTPAYASPTGENR